MNQTLSRQGKVLYDWPGEGCESSLEFLDSARQLGPQPFDVTIVGAGVVGCALAYRLSRFQLRALLIDKNFDVGEGSSKGNSAIIHTGFDATPGSLESKLVTQASRQWPVLAEKLKIPYDACGAVLLAIDGEQETQLPNIHKKALANGVDDVRLLVPREVKELEPNAPQNVRGGLVVPRESIVDPFTASIAFAEVALANGVDLLLGASVVAVENPSAAVKTLVTSSEKRVATRILVNAAGLGSRTLADAYAGQPFDINPRRGQFLIFDKFSRPLVGGIPLPVPTPQTKGVLVIPTIFGNLIAGPTAEDLPLDSPGTTCTTRDGVKAVLEGAARLPGGVPASGRQLPGQKIDKTRWLTDFYEAARNSIGLPVTKDSEAIRMFRVVLNEYSHLCRLRRELEEQVVARLLDHADFQRLQTIPGIGPILALFILAEAGDLRRFSQYQKFLKYCGLDLSTEQSGQFRGTTKLSKRGNARLRYAFWMAGTIAVRVRQNSFCRKFQDHIRRDPLNPDPRRKAYTAVAAKMARVVYAVIKTGTDYRRFPEATMPGGRIPSLRAVEANSTS